jgi:hypothetical protein
MQNNRCPFCGGLSVSVVDTRKIDKGADMLLSGIEAPCYVLCNGCLARGPVVMLDPARGTTAQAAVDQWRERAELDPITHTDFIDI